jgi:hypothetical protein
VSPRLRTARSAPSAPAILAVATGSMGT